jgi:peptidoglycan-associated lipoprotein
MKRYIAVLIVALFFAGCKSALKKAEDQFLSAKYETAIQMYNKILASPSAAGKENDINFLIGECYRLSNRARLAVPYYKAALDGGMVDNDNLNFHYGMALKANEQYADARTQLEKYAKGGSNPEHLRFARAEVRNLGGVKEILEAESHTKVKPCDAINTPAAEFAPVYYEGALVFASSRRNEKIFETTGTGFNDLYRFDMTDTANCVGTVQPFFGETFNLDGMHEASATFDPKNKFVIFARGNNGTKKELYRDVHLFISERHPERGWLPAQLLENVTDTAYWDACPALSPDGKTLYFASNRKVSGAFGGIDLYVSRLAENGTWSRPRNLGRSLNTPGDDMFPYVAPDGRLFFASNGHPGLGGLDLYVQDTVTVMDSLNKPVKQLKIKSLGVPINSSYDDFGIVFRNKGNGFFTSNRVGEGAKGDDDLYQFKNDSADIKFVDYCLRGNTFSRVKIDNSAPNQLGEVQVELKDGSGQVLETATSDASGKFTFKAKIEAGKTYQVTAKKDGYLSDSEPFTLAGKEVNPQTLPKRFNTVCFDVDLVLRKNLLSVNLPPTEIKGKVPPKLDLNRDLEIEINYEYDSTRITSEAAVILDEFAEFLAAYLAEYPSSVLELGSHTDARGNDKYNQRLSEGRARSAVRYLVAKGIPEASIRARGYGESQLKVKSAKTEPQHLQNRRTTVRPLKQ